MKKFIAVVLISVFTALTFCYGNALAYTGQVVSCIQKGQQDNLGYISPCSYCYTIRSLGSQYSPSYVNQIECSPENAQKPPFPRIPGGVCEQQFLNFQILQNNAQPGQYPNFSNATISVASACELTAQYNSVLSSYM